MGKTRRVAKLTGPKEWGIFEEELRPIQDDELLLKIVSVGLCHSEMPQYRGDFVFSFTEEGDQVVLPKEDVKYPVPTPAVSHFGFYGGHEPVAIVEEVGNDIENFEVGDYVVGPKPASFATYIIADTYRLLKIPSDIRTPKYCLGEMLMCIANIVRAAGPVMGDYVGLVGCGGMGLLALSGLADSSAFEVIAIDIDDNRLKWADKMGATKLINPKKTDVVEEVNKITGGNGVDIAIDITGKMVGFHTAAQIIKESKGKMLIPSYYAEAEPMISGNQLGLKAPIIHSVHPGYADDYMVEIEKGVEAYYEGILPLDELVTHEFSLDEINEAFEMLENPTDDFIKGVIIP